MGKIKITEKQASLLGLKKIKETMTNATTAASSVGAALGEVVTRIVVSGENVPRFKDKILQTIARQDPDSTVAFFEATKKIVGNVKEIRLDSIKRDIKSIDPTIIVEKSNPLKKLVKITKEQYNRVFASGLLNETEIKGGTDRINKEFKKTFSGKNIQNLKPVSEDKFNINKPSKDIPKLPKEVGHRESPMGEQVQMLNVGQDENEIHKETLELVKYLYRKSEELSPFWEKQGLTYDDITNKLLSDGIIIKKGGKCELSKKLGSPQTAIHALEEKLATLIPTLKSEPETDLHDEPVEPNLIKNVGDKNMEETSNYPAGTEDDPNAPWNKKDDKVTQTVPKNPELSVIGYNSEIALLKGPDGMLYVFNYDHINKNDFMEYAPLTRHYVGKDEEGNPEYDYEEEFDIDGDVLSNFINDKLKELTKGEGLDAYNKGVELVKIDEPLKQELLSLYDKNKDIAKALEPIKETSFPQIWDKFKSDTGEKFIPQKPEEKSPAKQSKIIAKLASLRDRELQRRGVNNENKTINDLQKANEEEIVDEMTGSGSAGAFTTALDMPVIKRKMPETPTVSEAIGTTSQAHDKLQWAGGSFVEPGPCSKPDNNKIAQNGGCNQGAGDAVKYTKGSGSIISPSLADNEILEQIAKKTGKSVDEIKKIIDSKKIKA